MEQMIKVDSLFQLIEHQDELSNFNKYRAICNVVRNVQFRNTILQQAVLNSTADIVFFVATKVTRSLLKNSLSANEEIKNNMITIKKDESVCVYSYKAINIYIVIDFDDVELSKRNFNMSKPMNWVIMNPEYIGTNIKKIINYIDCNNIYNSLMIIGKITEEEFTDFKQFYIRASKEGIATVISTKKDVPVNKNSTILKKIRNSQFTSQDLIKMGGES